MRQKASFTYIRGQSGRLGSAMVIPCTVIALLDRLFKQSDRVSRQHAHRHCKPLGQQDAQGLAGCLLSLDSGLNNAHLAES